VTSKHASKLRRFRWAIASFTATLWLFTGFLAVSPDWHHCFHEDSGTAQHHCLISKYSDGDFLTASAGALLTTFVPRVEPATPYFEISVDSASDHLLPPGRAPPIL
jgi:hypothetical protein